MAQFTELHEAQVADVASAEGLFSFLGVLWRRKWVALVGLLTCLILGGLYYFRATRVYESTAQILLIKKEKIPVAGSERERGTGRYSDYGYEDTVSTHMLLVTSPLIVGRAVESHRLASLPSLRPEPGEAPDDPVRWVTARIVEQLKAKRAGERSAPDPNVMNLSFEGTDPEDCAAVLTAVIDSYQKFLGETYQNFSAETVQLITQAKDVLAKQLTEKEAAYSAFRQKAPLFVWQGQGKDRVPISLPDLRISEIEKARSALLLEMANTQALREGVQAALDRKANREAITLLLRNSQRNMKEGTDLQGQAELLLLQNMLSEQEALEAYGPDHPKVKTARKKMATLREQYVTGAAPENSDTADFLKRYVEALAEEVKVGQQRLAEFDKLLDKERQASKEVLASQLLEENMRADLTRTQQTFDAVIKRLQEINLVKDYGGISMQLLSEPQLGELVRPKILIVVALALLAGLGFGVGVAYLVELADRSFRSPEDVRSQLGLPILGHIPIIPTRRDKEKAGQGGDGEAKPALHPLLCTFHHPKGRSAEAYRAVRTALYFGTGGESHKVIQVTSSGPGDGKTTLAANLAVAIADSGKRALLVDADFRRPRIAKFFDLDNAAGLGSLFTGEVELPDIIRPTPVENLWAIPCGPRPHNPADLLTSSRFKDFIEVVREKYDFVVIDSPPVLAVTDPSAIAPRVDGILFVLRLSKHARDAAMRAIEVIHTVGGHILGLVVNGLSASRGYGYGKYGYGRYRYAGYGKRGYGYGGYASGYGYGYHYQESPEGGTNGQEAGAEVSPTPNGTSADAGDGKPSAGKRHGKV